MKVSSVIDKKDQEFQLKIGSLIQSKNYSFQEDYKLGGVLGLGAFSTVRKVTHRKTKNIRAMKIITKTSLTSEEDKHKFVNEIEILRQIDHPHILKLYEFYQDTYNYYIIIEMATGGELYQKIVEYTRFPENEAAYVMQQILSAVVYAHNHNIVHRDLKPENILLDITSQGTYYIKVVDWGTSKKFSPQKPMIDKFGTPYYIAPDVLKKNYTEKCDIWSCGVILYILLSGQPPFKGQNEQEIMQNVLKGQYVLEGDIWDTISEDAKDLIRKMMEYKPEVRLSANKCLEHQWFKQFMVQDTKKVDKEQFTNNLSNLKNFKSENKLQQATLSFIATQLTSKEEKYSLTEVFKKIDKNGDGVLSKEEILDGFRQSFNMPRIEAQNEADRIFHRVDIDRSGKIDYHEFIVATMNRKKALSKDKIQQSFALFDQDGDGYITANELQTVLGSQLYRREQEQIFRQMINESDTNGDGQISLEEFTTLMEKYLNQQHQ